MWYISVASNVFLAGNADLKGDDVLFIVLDVHNICQKLGDNYNKIWQVIKYFHYILFLYVKILFTVHL